MANSNRTIKFRAWDKKEKIMYFGNGCGYDSDGDFSVDSVTTLIKTKDAGEAIKRLVWMQYTGLKDKNGKEIYEGDILKIVIGDNKFIFEVGWEVESFVLDNYGLLSEYRNSTEYIEVIGNIYENPELLEGEK